MDFFLLQLKQNQLLMKVEQKYLHLNYQPEQQVILLWEHQRQSYHQHQYPSHHLAI